MPDNDFVEVATDGSGKRIRNLSAQVLQADGSIQTVYMQVVALADENGNLLNNDNDLLEGILAELQAIRLHMELHS